MVDLSVPESVPEPQRKELLSQSEFLERGHPGEILPGPQLVRLQRAAEDYVRDADNPPDGRTRVRSVWLQGIYQPAYQKFTPRSAPDPDFG